MLHHSLDIQDIWGQGYDSSRNMQGEWNGLKALVSNDYPSTYTFIVLHIACN